jgi:hypothetical protein
MKLLTKQLAVADTMRTFQEIGDVDETDEASDVMLN